MKRSWADVASGTGLTDTVPAAGPDAVCAAAAVAAPVALLLVL
jgi:hypothetical protein